MGHTAVVEVLDREGGVRASHRVSQWPVRIGRAPQCDVALDDPHLAGTHAELFVDHGQAESEGAGAAAGPVRLRLLASLNGGWLANRHLAAGDELDLPGGSVFQLGATRLRVRTSWDPLPPEVPYVQEAPAVRTGARVWSVCAALVLLAVWTFVDKWISLDPGEKPIEYFKAVLLPIVLVSLWAFFWSGATQLFQRHFPFVVHLGRVLVIVLVMGALDVVMPVWAYMLSTPRLVGLGEVISNLLLGFLIWWHATLVWPRRRRWLAAGVALVVALLLGVTVAERQERQHLFGPLYLSKLPPPGLRLAAPRSPEALLGEVRGLQPVLAAAAERARREQEPKAAR